MVKEILRKFGYVKLNTLSKSSVTVDKAFTYFKDDIITLSFRKGEQIIVQTGNKKVAEALKDMAALLDADNNDVSIDSVVDILNTFNLTLAIKSIISEE